MLLDLERQVRYCLRLADRYMLLYRVRCGPHQLALPHFW